MKQVFILTSALLLTITAIGQKSTYLSIAGFTTQNAMPFAKFSGLVKEIVHPGAEIGFGKIFASKQQHNWFTEIKFAYFYHRFVQHGLPLYINVGYRHIIYKGFAAETSLGAGYMHSIPATAKLKLNDNGEYVNNKGLGRMQAIVSFGIGLSYLVNKSTTKPIRRFINYQQRIQFPFVKSYVPLLPYNSLIIGISKSIHHHHNV